MLIKILSKGRWQSRVSDTQGSQNRVKPQIGTDLSRHRNQTTFASKANKSRGFKSILKSYDQDIKRISK